MYDDNRMLCRSKDIKGWKERSVAVDSHTCSEYICNMGVKDE